MTYRNPKYPKYLDAEKLFRKYWEMGENRSIKLLTEWAILDGMKSSTGSNPTPMGIWKAMWRWASLKENRSTVWYLISLHSSISKEHWEWDMVNVKIPTAWQHPTRDKKERFMKENGWS